MDENDRRLLRRCLATVGAHLDHDFPRYRRLVDEAAGDDPRAMVHATAAFAEALIDELTRRGLDGRGLVRDVAAELAERPPEDGSSEP